MAQLNDLIVTGKSRFLNSISGNITGTASNVTGTVAIANGGTGATTAANARTALGLGGAAVKGVTDTYSSTGTDLTTGKAIANALGTLNISLTGVPGSSNTLTAFSQINGKVNATFGSISITKSQISDFPTSMTPSSHTHGNIQNGGTLQTNDITIASGDKLVVTDSSDSSKLARTSISFDGSTTTQCLTKKGTWATFGTSNLTIGTTATTAMAGNTNVNNVTQTDTATSSAASYYNILFSNAAADTTTRTDSVRKSAYLFFDTKDSTLTTGNLVASSTVYAADVSNLTSTWDGTNTSLKTAISSIPKVKVADYTFTFPSTATAYYEHYYYDVTYSNLNIPTTGITIINAFVANVGNNIPAFAQCVAPSAFRVYSRYADIKGKTITMRVIYI